MALLNICSWNHWTKLFFDIISVSCLVAKQVLGSPFFCVLSWPTRHRCLILGRLNSAPSLPLFIWSWRRLHSVGISFYSSWLAHFMPPYTGRFGLALGFATSSGTCYPVVVLLLGYSRVTESFSLTCSLEFGCYNLSVVTVIPLTFFSVKIFYDIYSLFKDHIVLHFSLRKWQQSVWIE